VLVITRDAVILIGTIVLHLLTGEARVKPSWIGKTATAMQMTAIACVLLQLSLFTATIPIFRWRLTIDFLDIPVTIAALFTLLSGIGYVMGGIRQLQAEGHAHARP
jgi:phosphatidylglycerophosphate synthase